MLAYLWPVGVAALTIWLIVAAVFRYSSLAALVAAVLAPVFAWFFALGAAISVAVVSILAVLVLILRTPDNIGRLLRGEESHISLSSRKSLTWRDAPSIRRSGWIGCA